MLLERMGETVTLERPDGETVEVEHALCYEASLSDQSVMDVQTRFINQARYKGDQVTISVVWPSTAPRDVMDCHLWVRGQRYRVYSLPFPVSYSPVRYDMQLTCVRSLFLYDIELLAPVNQTFDEWGKPSCEWERVPVKANMLRLAESADTDARQRDLAAMSLFELDAADWDARYTSFAYDGMTYPISSVDTAHDSVVVGGRAEVTDA